MDRGDVIRGYAQALFTLARAEGSIDRLSDELFRFAKAVEQNYDLRKALTDIHVPAERKQQMLAELIGQQVSEQTLHILSFVISEGRAGELTAIVDELSQLAAAERDKILAEVRSAVDLTPEQRDRLGEALGRATGKNVEVKVVLDPDVLGGIYAKVGDQVIDGTVRHKLQELKERLEV